ncbi:MAG TPA: dienelactone hydrolase family protein [Gemmatimonadaceae bacterium]|nr:dienelactone hydrolase family protein [Gemmatimonadaceae bacterium]
MTISRRLAVPAALVMLFAPACTIQYVPPSSNASDESGGSNGPAAPDDHVGHMSAEDLVAPVTTPLQGGAQGTPGIPASARTAAARLQASPRHAEWVKIALEPGSADSIMAWIVYPATSARAPVVVVVHEIFGLQTWVRGVADQVAADGFIAIAPDFLSRVRGGPSSVELSADSARRLIGGVNVAERNRVIAAAANYAMMQPAAAQKYAVIGYCWGGTTTWGHAVNGGVRGFSGGVAFYGSPYTSGGSRATAAAPAVPATVTADSLAKVGMPMMLLNGDKDTRIGAMMPAIDSIMRAHGKTYSGVNYPGAVHGFLRAQDDPKEQRDEAEEQANLSASRDGWRRTIEFLKRHLADN